MPRARWCRVVLSSMRRRRPSSRLFPYTTLFRSGAEHGTHVQLARGLGEAHHPVEPVVVGDRDRVQAEPGRLLGQFLGVARRSEEHTSELQSRQYLLCRLLLDKKKQALEQPACPA